jgi:uncharacterized membrane protein YukC
MLICFFGVVKSVIATAHHEKEIKKEQKLIFVQKRKHAINTQSPIGQCFLYIFKFLFWAYSLDMSRDLWLTVSYL